MLYLDWPLRFLNWQVNVNGLSESQVAGPASSNFIIQEQVQGLPWSSIATNRATSSIIEFTDPMSFPNHSSSNGPSSTSRLYRAWLAP